MGSVPKVLIHRDGRWLGLDRVERVVRARRADEVAGLLGELEGVAARGGVAVGFLAYEAAPGIDRRLETQPAGEVPLAWFAVGRTLVEAGPGALPGAAGAFQLGALRATVGEARYRRAIAKIHRRIAAGDTYQVNFTFRLRGRFDGEPAALFRDRMTVRPAPFAAYLDLGRFAVCSASPELFFELEGEHVRCRPMKGTARRGPTLADDEAAAARLAGSAKERAENVMIADMVRNDLGRVALPGSVATPALFTVERHETVHQMTSTVTARSRAGLPALFAALFPSASVTGAPKVRTMQLIAGLESSPRGVYTGALGVVGPGRRARFSVAIRTLVIDRERGRAEYGTGSGVVWDSRAAAEHRECRAKALVLTRPPERFDLLETLAWEPAAGYRLLDRHLDRLAGSARYFAIPCDLERVRHRLAGAAAGFGDRPRRVRLTLGPGGEPAVEAQPLAPLPSPLRVALDDRPVDAGDRFLFHKTTQRRVYDEARRRHPEHDDVILWNSRREITESTLANVVVETGSGAVTPPVRCGLLAGVMRGELLDRGELVERVVTIDQLTAAPALYLINSVRGRMEARLDASSEAGTSRGAA